MLNLQLFQWGKNALFLHQAAFHELVAVLGLGGRLPCSISHLRGLQEASAILLPRIRSLRNDLNAGVVGDLISSSGVLSTGNGEHGVWKPSTAVLGISVTNASSDLT